MNTNVMTVEFNGIQMTLNSMVTYNNKEYLLKWEDPRELYLSDGTKTIRVPKDACTY
jgi:hypothetical protein